MSGTVLVTGVTGFTGPYVREALERRGQRVVGLTNVHSAHRDDAAVDLLDETALGAFVGRVPFDAVMHLAGVSFVAHGNAADFYRSNLLGTLNLLEAVARSGRPMRKVILASSANVYGRPAQLPVDESTAPAPLSHYGASKLAMELMARLWFDRLPILITRPFNYTGLGQSPKFVVAKLAAHFRSRAPEIELGDTSVVREFMDVRDVAEIYCDLLDCVATSSVVNICAGVGYSLDEVFSVLSRLSGAAPAVRRAQGLVRGNEIPTLVGSPRLLEELIAKRAFRPLAETLGWMLNA